MTLKAYKCNHIIYYIIDKAFNKGHVHKYTWKYMYMCILFCINFAPKLYKISILILLKIFSTII